jgi:hypothetical protein
MTGIILTNGTEGVQIVGNTVFNWGDQTRLCVGINEDATCRNNLIVGNNINYFTEADIISKGNATQVSNNVSEGPISYGNFGKPPYPDFTREPLERFMAL